MNVLIQPLKKKLLAIFANPFRKIKTDKSDHILYKIVDVYVAQETEYYKIHCSYTKAIFSSTLHDIVFDLDILYGLHPIQGCFIGIEYAKILKCTTHDRKYQEKQYNKLTTSAMIHRYGKHKLLYQDRKGFVGFECTNKNKQFLMDPRDIALSQELIEEFDAAQAFYIGVWAGIKFANPIIKLQEHNKKEKINHLRLVKG